MDDEVSHRIHTRQFGCHFEMRWQEASQFPTDKMGRLNFQASTMILTLIVSLIILNMVSFIGGAARIFIEGSWNETFGKDKGRVPTSVTLLPLVITNFLVCFGHMDLKC
ncbi:hypothetical protein NC653_021520 [Populus alba x Populus x berolinensis]|uniref:Uncharacterized protein n=1 Tax=Populus alba x Populus x berolinensis TaxID=444605 RepID=A0AAD6QEP6_9ROSI|nr:hypothetical protein NC653_021520 [Populus alba x Populus x berolinensis]